MKIIITRLITSNGIVCTPLADFSVNSLAKYVSVRPFWWNAIQKKITTANTRHRATMRCLVSSFESSGSVLTAAALSFFLPPSTWRKDERKA